MARIVLRNFVVTGALVVSAGGREVEPGDEVRLFLNQAANPALPEFVDGLVYPPVSRVTITDGGCAKDGTSYNFEYDTADLNGAVTQLQICDIRDVAVINCCIKLREALDEEIATREELDAEVKDMQAIELDNPPVDFVAGARQVEQQTGVGTILTSGTVKVTVTSAVVPGSPLEILVPVAAGDIPTVWVAKVAAALENTPAIADHFEVDNVGADFSLTSKLPLANDATLNIAVDNGSATGVTPNATSNTLIAGVAEIPGIPATSLGQFAFGPWGFAQARSVDPPSWQILDNRDDVNGKIIQYNRGIITLTGGSSVALDGIETVDLSIGELQTYVEDLNNVTCWYRLNSASSAETPPTHIRPDDFSSPANAKVWIMQSLRMFNANVHGGVVLYKNTSGSDATFSSSALSGSRTYTVPNASGVLALVADNQGRIYSSDIQDKSTGGGAASDSGRVAAYNSSGVLTSSNTFVVRNTVGAYSGTISVANLTGNVTVQLPTSSGIMARSSRNDGLISVADLVTEPGAGNAVGGQLGQFMSSSVASGSAVSLTTATAADVTTLSLPAGDWDVEGHVIFDEASATVTARDANVNSSTAIKTDGTEVTDNRATTTTSQKVTLSCIRTRVSIASNTTIRLVARATFSAGTVSAYGTINARRVR